MLLLSLLKMAFWSPTKLRPRKLVIFLKNCKRIRKTLSGTKSYNFTTSPYQPRADAGCLLVQQGLDLQFHRPSLGYQLLNISAVVERCQTDGYGQCRHYRTGALS